MNSRDAAAYGNGLNWVSSGINRVSRGAGMLDI